jgi:hypothetical protein
VLTQRGLRAQAHRRCATWRRVGAAPSAPRRAAVHRRLGRWHADAAQRARRSVSDPRRAPSDGRSRSTHAAGRSRRRARSTHVLDARPRAARRERARIHPRAPSGHPVPGVLRRRAVAPPLDWRTTWTRRLRLEDARRSPASRPKSSRGGRPPPDRRSARPDRSSARPRQARPWARPTVTDRRRRAWTVLSPSWQAPAGRRRQAPRVARPPPRVPVRRRAAASLPRSRSAPGRRPTAPHRAAAAGRADRRSRSGRRRRGCRAGRTARRGRTRRSDRSSRRRRPPRPSRPSSQRWSRAS